MAPVLHSFKQDVHPQQSFGYLIYAFPVSSVFIRLPGQTSKHRFATNTFIFINSDAHIVHPPFTSSIKLLESFHPLSLY